MSQTECTSYSLFVNNITSGTRTRYDLYRHFGKYGSVQRVFIHRDKTNDRRDFAFVHYKQQNQAQRAVDNLDGQFLRGRKLRVRFTQYRFNADGIHGGRKKDSPSKLSRRRSSSRNPRPRYRDEYRDKVHRRSQSRSRSRERYHRYHGRDRDYHRRSRSRSKERHERDKYHEKDRDYHCRGRSRSKERHELDMYHERDRETYERDKHHQNRDYHRRKRNCSASPDYHKYRKRGKYDEKRRTRSRSYDRFE